MRITDIVGLERLITNQIPESASLEYKSDLVLGSDKQRAEVLKDLTGMGNGGGGTLIFGMEEEDETSVAKALTPLPLALVEGQLEDIVRDAVHPPILWEHYLVPHAGGWVLIAEVEPSVIGPYRIDAYKEGRYYKRVGNKTFPMSEQDVRDAYSLAERSLANREGLWKSHFLPMDVPLSKPWLVISGLPREPISDLFDPLPIDPSRYNTVDKTLQDNLGHTQLGAALSAMTYWAGGVAGDDGAGNAEDELCAVRFHRDGAVAVAHRLPEVIDMRDALRVLNTLLVHISNLWRTHSLRRPVEMQFDILNLDLAKLSTMPNGMLNLDLIQPAGINVGNISIEMEVLPSNLEFAHFRHRIAERLSTHLALAYGTRPTGELFNFGYLFERDGRLTRSMLGTGDLLVDANGLVTTYAIEDTGQILDPGGAQVFVNEGVLLDVNGNTLALLEMATGLGCPADFIPRILDRSGPRHRPDVTRRMSSTGQSSPAPTGTWSTTTIAELLG